jgi:hypothetical protein
MTSSIGSISYPASQPDLTVTIPFKKVRKQITEGGVVKDVLEAWADFGGAVSQVNTITITAGSTGNDYLIGISDGTNDAIVSYVQQSGDTATVIAARLLEEINGVPSASALVSGTASANVLTLTSDLPGVTITYDVSGSTTPGNIVVAQTTAASGTAKMRKIGEIKTYFILPVGGRNIAVVSQVVFYDGANPPAIARTGAESSANHPTSMEAISASVNG